ncbi:hypothetical protein SCP_0300330 [Sparassis crispa]|uniref:Uncharacterized protein n=1 Tax=Sparassis crispa TaxID=139825 RepID=A0A401GDQ1_9APHY|nr:hypothetical protein SCP_0300330 [Sparassis crispa]GBE80318.1 hypothetical protein SCP_0300330 [Sparassis crispa]
MAIVERLQRLKEYQRAWRALDFSAEVTIPEGVSFLSISPSALAQPEASRSGIEIVHLPSRLRGLEEKRWQCLIQDEKIDMSTVLIEVDIDQDLLVLIQELEDEHAFPPTKTARIQFRSLATGDPHPLARVSALSPVEMFYDPDHALSLQADVLAWLELEGDIYEDDGRSVLRLWNWKTGNLIWKMSSEYSARCPRSFAFLNCDHFLVCLGDQLVVYSVDVDCEEMTCVPSGDGDYVCAFNLPERSSNALRGLTIAMQAIPFSEQRQLSPAPFHADASERLFLITIILLPTGVDDGDRHDVFILFVPSSTFLSSLAKVEAGRARRNLPWDAWGPTGSRMIEVLADGLHQIFPAPDDWHLFVDDVCTSSGLRGLVTYASWIITEEQPIMLEVYDFTPGAVRQLTPLTSLPTRTIRPTETSTTYVTGPSTIRKPSSFVRDVVTSLPYCLSRTRISLSSEENRLEKAVLMADGVMVQDSGPQFRVLTI